MKIIDISHVIDVNSPVYPGDGEIKFEKINSVKRDQYSLSQINMNMHVGTHVDFPAHVIENGKTGISYSIRDMISRGIMLDVRKHKEIKYKAEYEDVIHQGDIVLLFTALDESYGNKEYYSSHSIISSDFADFLVRKKVKAIGIDAPSFEINSTDIHVKLLEKDILIIENLTKLDNLVGLNDFEVNCIFHSIDLEASIAKVFCRTY